MVTLQLQKVARSSVNIEDPAVRGSAFWFAHSVMASFHQMSRIDKRPIVLRLVNFATQRGFSGKVGVALEIVGRPRFWRGNANAFRWHHDWPMFHGTMMQSDYPSIGPRWQMERARRRRGLCSGSRASMTDVFGKVADQWFGMGRVVRNVFAS
jgi:hypothetical protein